MWFSKLNSFFSKKNFFIFLVSIHVTYQVNAQHLTISTSGETVSPGTNWSITGNTLNVAASGSANVHPNVISNHLNNVGDLTVNLPWQSMQIRQCSIDGTITYTGSATRTLTFLIANDIFITTPNQSITATGTGALNVVLRAANSGGVSPDNGRISIRQNNTINTNGGHLWIGGGSVDVTWNGLTVGNHFARTWSDNEPGLWIENSTLNTNGGNVYLAGLSHNSSANSGENYGVRMVNSDISSVSGNIVINGELRGRYQIGYGTRIESTTTTATSITTTTGSITISGKGYDADPNDNGYRFGADISGSSSTIKTIISSTSGNIQIEGNAYFTATVNDKEGLGIGGATEIISRSGNITIRGTNTLETSGHYCNSIRFNPRTESNSIRVGFDGTNSYTGNILIEGNSIYQRYLHSSAGSIAVQTTGTLTIQPTGTAYTYMRANDPGGTLTYDNDWNFGTTLSSFTFGKSTNTTNLTFANVLSTAGPITIYGGNININENLNTSAGASSGNVLLKSSADIILAANKSITTSGASVILWANSDNGTANGSIALRNGSSIVTGSNTVAGGHVWLGGGSNGTTWNGLAVGSGYAVPGTIFTPSNGGGTVNSGIYLERNSITSFGGNIKISGDAGASGFAAIVTYGNTITINAGSGKIEMDGQVISTGPGNRNGILFGLHDKNIFSTVNISSSSTSGDAITITGVGRGTEDAIGLSGTVNITASGGGNIVMNGNALGTGRSIVAGNFYHGILNVFANSGNISLNGNTKAVQVATAIDLTGLTSGPSKINIGQGGSISSSSSNVVLTADNIALAAGGIAVNTSGTVTIEPSSNSFASALTYPVTNLSIANTITGLTLGKSTNTANITVSSAQSIAGPIAIYGGNVFAQQNLTSTLSGAAILLQATGYIDVSASRTIQTNNGNITLRANASGTANTITSAITLNSGASLLSTGGNITLGGNFAGTQGAGLYAASARVGGSPGILINNATLNAAGGNINIYGRCSTSYDDGIRLQASISTTGAGTIGLYGDAFGGYNGTQFFGGITFFNEISRIETENGNVSLEGILTNSQSAQGYALSFYRNLGSSGQTKHIQILSQTGDIQITADPGNTIGQGIGHSSWGNIYFGSPLNNSFNATGNITFTYSNLVNAGSNGFKVKTTGAVVYEPVLTSFIAAQTLPANTNYTIANGASSLTIGKLGNTANITMSSAQTVEGPITIYAGTITLNSDLTATNNGAISFYSDNAIAGLTTQRNVTAAGALNYIPQSNSFGAAVTYPITNLNVFSTGLLIGKTTNTANVTFGNVTAINGPITAYGGTIAVNENVTSSAGSTISLYGNNLSIATGKTINSVGQLIIAPQNPSNSIGLAGATGTLQLPVGYFSTNFTDGFSRIIIGTNNQTGMISTGAFNLRDTMTLLTTGALQLIGKPVLGNNHLTLGEGITSINVGSPANYFQTNATGRVFRSVPNSVSRLFPIGKAYYNPVTISNNTGTTSDFSARVLDSVFLEGLSGSLITTPHVKSTWDINKLTSNAAQGVDLEFGWSQAQESGTLNSFALNHYNGANWENAIGTSQATNGTSFKTMLHEDYTGSFSPFAINEGNSPLPVELISFNIVCLDNQPSITWQTASESNSNFFELERSKDGMDWESVGLVSAAGNSMSTTNYSLIDSSLSSRTSNYYRLIQVDLDGQQEVFGPISSNCASLNLFEMKVFPNPNFGKFVLEFASQFEEVITIHIFSADGKSVYQRVFSVVEGTSSCPIELDNLNSGIYNIQISHNQGVFSRKIVIE